MFAKIARAALLTLAAGCGIYDLPGPSSAPVVLPDIAGNWSFTFTAYPEGSIAGTAGVCTGAMTMSLSRTEAAMFGDRFAGMPSELTFHCSGLSSEALAALGDSVLALPRDTVSVSVSQNICGFNFYVNPDCDSRGTSVSIMAPSLYLSGDSPNSRRMGGDAIFWNQSGDTVILRGTFVASNDSYRGP